jgi:hypothetical protein
MKISVFVLLIVATVFAQDDANATSTTTTTTTTSLPTQEAVVGNATQAADGGDNADGNVQNDEPAAGDVSTPAAENVAVSEANANAESQTGTNGTDESSASGFHFSLALLCFALFTTLN